MWVLSPVCLMDLAAAGSICRLSKSTSGQSHTIWLATGTAQVQHTEPGPAPPLQLGLA